VKSLVEYAKRSAHYWWALVAGGVLGVIGLRDLIEGSHHNVPWFWLFWAVVALGVAQFMAFRDVCRERDDANNELTKLETSPVAMNVNVDTQINVAPGGTLNMPESEGTSEEPESPPTGDDRT
jgi:hypothetical protein